MAFYEGRRGTRAYDDVHDVPNVGVKKPVASTPEERAANAQDWSSRRRAQPSEVLLPHALKRLNELPSDARPDALAAQFPRVLNLIALHWDDEAACPAYFDGLLTDHRGGRQGFPDAVRRDLEALRRHWFHRRIDPQRA